MRHVTAYPRAGGLIGPCLPSPAKAPPSGPDWFHEIKHDGFRILARRDADCRDFVGSAIATLYRSSPIDNL
jgi:hypothetical protein